jgi:hypothetical protein
LVNYFILLGLIFVILFADGEDNHTRFLLYLSTGTSLLLLVLDCISNFRCLCELHSLPHNIDIYRFPEKQKTRNPDCRFHTEECERVRLCEKRLVWVFLGRGYLWMSRLVVFVVDTSVSMGQSLGGLSALDASKAACEHYLKKSGASKVERFFLVSCGSGMSSVLAGWKDPPARLLEQLKSLKPEHVGDLGAAVRKAFDLLNLLRQQSGVDHLGAGRKPWSLLQGHVIVLTDGGAAEMDVVGTNNNLMSPNLLMPDWYRWDQRLFAVINSFPRLLGAPLEPVTDSPSVSKLQQLCEQTGGTAYFPTSLSNLLAVMELILDRTQ